MHKIVHELFEIDLSTLDITIVEENSWFSDTFFTKYSFPFSLELTDDVKSTFQELLELRTKEITLEYEVTYVFNNIMEKGILTIESFLETINFKLKYGIEEFPNFSKKLSEIGLETITVADIYTHAKEVITESWPDIKYNFPQIHTDKIDTSVTMWSAFQKIINNYKDDDFVINEVIDDIPYNRNLMQPIPYFMYILTRGFETAGFTLLGDVLEINVLKKKLLYFETDYFKILDQANISTIITGADKNSVSNGKAYFSKIIPLPSGGRYNISGTVYITGKWKDWCSIHISYRNKNLWKFDLKEGKHHSGYIYSFDIDITFDTIADGDPHEILFESIQLYREENIVADFYTTSLFLYNELGVAIPNIVNNNVINLSKLVPDLTFGTFVTAIKNWYNLDLTLDGKNIYMNFIEKEINYNNALDLSEFETIPERIYQKGASFLMKFLDPADDVNKHDEVFFNTGGYSTANFTKTDETTQIEIQAFPLKNFFRNEVQTAYAVEADKSKIYAVLYDGLNAQDLNLTIDPSPMLLSNTAYIYYEKWFEFRLASINLKWSFSAYNENLIGLNSKRKLFAFGRFLIIKTLTKQQSSNGLLDVEIDAFTLE